MDHLFHILEPLAIIIGGFSVPVAFAVRWADKHVAQPLKEVPVLACDLADLKHTLTVNGNTSDPPTILDRLQNVEKLGADLVRGHREITLHLSQQDRDARDVAGLAVATAQDVKHTAAEVASALRHDG